jgi:DNA invertase Pin-like site-specific DNA recombinase
VLVGYMRASQAESAHALELQRDALIAAGVDPSRLYEDHVSGQRGGRPGLDTCLQSLGPDDTLITWTLDRLGRNLHHLVTLVHELTGRGIGLRILAGEGIIDTARPNGWLIAGVFAALAEFERERSLERARAGLAFARARGRRGGRSYKMTPAKLRLAQAAIGRRETKVRELCAELGVTRQTLYRHVDPEGCLRPDGERLLRQQHVEPGREWSAGPGETEANGPYA